MADIDRTELYAFIEKSIRAALQQKLPDTPQKNVEALVAKAVEAVLKMDPWSRTRSAIGHGGSGGKIEATREVRLTIQHLQEKYPPVTRQEVEKMGRPAAVPALDAMNAIAERDDIIRRGSSKKMVGYYKAAATKKLKEAGLVEVNGLLFWEEDWKRIEKELKASEPLPMTGKLRTIATRPLIPKEQLKPGKPEPIPDVDIPAETRYLVQRWQKKDRFPKGMSEEERVEYIKELKPQYKRALKKANLVDVDGVLYRKEEWDFYQKELRKEKVEKVASPKTKPPTKRKKLTDAEVAELYDVDFGVEEQQVDKVIKEAKAKKPKKRAEPKEVRTPEVTEEQKAPEPEPVKVEPPSQPPPPEQPPVSVAPPPEPPKKPEPVSLKNYPEVAKAEQRLDEISKRISQGEKVTEEEVEKAGKAMLKAEKGAKLVRVKGVLYTKEQWEAYEKQLKENEPEALVSKTTAKTEEISPEILAREREREAKVAKTEEIKRNVEKNLTEVGEQYTGKSQEEVTKEISEGLTNLYGTEGITKEEILQIVQEAVQNFFKGQVTAEEVDSDVKERVDKAGATVEKEQGVPIAKEKTEEKVEINYKELEEKLREKVRKLFDEIGKSLDRAVPDEAVDEVAKSMRGFGDDKLNLGSFNEADYAINAVAKGAPALAFDEIKEMMREFQLLSPEGAKKTVRGKDGFIDEKDIQQARKYLEALKEIEKQTAHMFKTQPTMSKEFKKLDPRFLEDPNRNFQIHREASTGTMIGKSSFKDEYGILQKATVVVDKYGDAIATTTNRHASFFQGIARDVREFAKWSIAIALVYTPMQKLKELIDLSIRSQTLLADTIVTLGESQEATTKIFESAAKIAETTGSSILGVIEGYNLALRASGDAANAAERYAVANQLLTDSIILSKLSTLSQAEATDTLVAALKQTNIPLDQGQQLLDKWVKVTRVANVDLTTLATSFSIVGEAAANAGLDIDELNGLIALMASQTGLSAKETGNAVRALVSGYTSDPATKELAKFGIAVKNLDGDAREFQDVMMDIKTAFEAGLISESQLNKIAYAIGGGNRRQAQVVTSIVNLDTMNRVASESALAQGEAQKALGIELDTVSTKATLLSNSFTKLAQSVGMEGGVLSGISSLTSGLTWLVEALNEVIKVAGTAGPALATLGIGAFLTKGKPGFMKTAIGAVASPIGSMIGTVGTNVEVNRDSNLIRSLGYYPQPLNKEQFTSKVDVAQAQTIKWSQEHTRDIGNGIAMFMMAGLRAAKGDWAGAGISIATSALTTWATKNSTWGLIGTTIASAFLNYVEQTKSMIGRAPLVVETPKPGEQTEEEAASSLTKDLSELVNGPAFLYEYSVAMHKLGQNLFSGITGQDPLNATQIAAAVAYKYGASTEEIAEAFQDAANAGLEGLVDVKSSYTQKIEGLRGTEIDFTKFDTGAALGDTKAKLRTEFYEEPTGMSPTEFRKRLDMLTGANAQMTKWTDALNFAGSNLEVFGRTATTAADLYNEFTKIVLYGSEEQINFINSHIAEMEDAYNDLQGYIKGGEEKYAKEIESTKIVLAELQETFPELISSTLEQIQLSRTTLPSLERQRDLGEEDFDIVVKVAERLVKEWGDALGAEEKAVWENNVKDQRKMIEIAPGEFREVTKGIAEFFGEAMNLAIEENLIEKPEPPGIQQLDISKAQYDQVKAQTDALVAKLEKDFGYESEEERIITELDDKQWHDLTTDWKIFNILLQEILDTEKKQLEGIYNLPANGTFWVPFQARQIEPGATGLDTGALEAEVGTAGNQIKTAIELAAAQIADAIKVEKMVAETPPQNLTIEQAKDKFTEDFSNWLSTQASQESEERDRRWWVTPQPDRWASDPNSEQYKQNYEDSLDLINNMFSFESYLNKLQPFGEPQIQDNEEVSIWQQILDAIKSYTSTIASAQQSWMQRLLSPQSTPQSRLLPQQTTPYIPMSGNINTGPISGNLRDTAISQANMAIPASQQKLNMNITSNVNLRLDGRVVANVVKRYLGESLLRYSSTGGSISRSVIV